MIRIASTTTASAFASLLLLAGCGSSTAPDNSRGEDRFDRNSLSRYVAEADEQQSSWVVTGGELVATGPSIHGVLRRKGTSFADGWVETATAHADDGGLVLRHQGNANYALLAFRDDSAPFPRGERNLAVYDRVNGAFVQLWEADVVWPRGTMRVIRFEAEGQTLRVYVNGELMAHGPTVHTIGTGIGLRHYGADATWQTRFDRFRWHAAD